MPATPTTHTEITTAKPVVLWDDVDFRNADLGADLAAQLDGIATDIDSVLGLADELDYLDQRHDADRYYGHVRGYQAEMASLRERTDAETYARASRLETEVAVDILDAEDALASAAAADRESQVRAYHASVL